ncbi:DNA topoisomerase 2-binding protein 1 [Gryganskiella cystojenkinii]|nr:DNA topoisomerase 2-binding protein 1 [Gryganskiella cystojenkinii]
MPLHGCNISYTGFSVADREVVNTKVRAMGGEINVDLTEDVTHLLVAKAGSQKYKVALALGIPVLSPNWLTKLYERWQKNEPLELKALAAENSLDTRLQIEEETIKHGGIYTNDLLRGKTTHLLCHRPTGLKYTSALQWGLHCVPIDWFKDSIQNLCRAEESKYEAQLNNTTRSASINGKEPVEPDVDMEPKKSHALQDQMYLEACYIYVAPGFSEDMVTRLKKMIRMGNGVQVLEYHALEVTHVVVPSDTLDESTVALFNQEIDLPYIVNYQWLRQCNRAGKLLPEANYIVPFPTRTEDGQLKPVRFNGATTWTTDSAFKSSNPVTVIKNNRSKALVVAAGSNDSTLADNGQHISNGSKMTMYRERSNTSPTSSPIVTPAETSESNSPVELRRGLRNRSDSGILTDAIGDLSMVSTTQLPTQENSLISRAGNMLLEEEEEEEEEEGMRSIFMGLYISTHGWSSDKMVTAIQRETVARGGTFVAEGETPPVSPDQIYTIVPLARSAQSLTHLKTVVLTSCWFERSLETDRVVPRNEHFLNKPIPVLPIPGFETLNITLGNGSMREFEYNQVGKAIGHMGATFSETCNSKTTDLLVTDKASGPKYDIMVKAGKPIVRLQWLKDCASQGKRLSFQDYLLKAPKGNEIMRKNSNKDVALTRQRSNGKSRSNSPFDNQLVPVYHAAPTERILEGLSIYLHGRVLGDHVEMQDMISEMGAQLFTSFNGGITHLVHEGKATPEVVKEIKLAKRKGILLVSPGWLYACRKTGMRVDERGYPERFGSNHLTLQTIPSTQPSSSSSSMAVTRAGTRGKSAATSPSVLTSASTSSTLSTRMKRSATTGTFSQAHGGSELTLTQPQARTAAALTSSLMKREASSVTQSNSLDSSFDVSMMNGMDTASLRSMASTIGGASNSLPMEEPKPFIDDGGDGIWQPLPRVPVVREERKRRRPQPEDESTDNTTPLPPTTENEERVDYFAKTNKFGPEVIYWDDVESRQRKKAFYEKLGYPLPEKSRAQNAEAESEQERERRDLASQAPKQLCFLLTGVLTSDRSRLKKIINELGGMVLEDVYKEDEESWKAKVTHLVTNGRNPQKTNKLKIALESHALVVNKTFLAESADQGRFVDETPHLV